MSEPSTHVPGEVADAQVDEEAQTSETSEPPAADKVELDLDEEKLEAWDEVKSDYQVDPDAEDTPTGTDDEGMPEGNAPG